MRFNQVKSTEASREDEFIFHDGSSKTNIAQASRRLFSSDFTPSRSHFIVYGAIKFTSANQI